MTDNNIEKTISCDGTDYGAHILVSKYPLVYFKVLLERKDEFPYCGKDITEQNDNGR
jgi:hypothetical protein